MTFSDPPYVGINTFLNAPYVGMPKDVKYGFLGVPYSRGTSNRPGANFGPNAIRAASKMLCEGIPGLFDFGDVSMAAPDDEAILAKIELDVAGLLYFNAYPLIAGGDHTITLAVLRAMRKHYGRPVRIVHFDAHPDTWPDNWGIKYGHGSFVRHAVDEGLIDPHFSWMIGVRCPMQEDVWVYTLDTIGNVITAGEVLNNRVTVDDIAERLSRDSDIPTYLTLDIDCLDPVYAPGTGTPEIAGLTTHWLKSFLGHPAMPKVNWIGMDVVEVCPAYDQSEITALAAATFLYLHASIIDK